MSPYEVNALKLTGNEDYVLVDNAEYPDEGDDIVNDNGLLDIHAGAFETAWMDAFYKEMVDEGKAVTLKDYSLNGETIKEWLKGGQDSRKVVPLGYAGNPSAYKVGFEGLKNDYGIMAKYVASRIVEIHKNK